MQSLILGILLAYVLFLIVLGVLDAKKAKDFDDFAVAGKKQKAFPVTLSILATVLGASTTMGIADTSFKLGFPAVWWLWFGAIGLILQAVFISKKVRELNASTLPGAAGILAGKPAEIALAAVIVISWIGVIAGQLVALYGLLNFILGKDSKAVFIVVALVIVIYTCFGGQLSVVRTDMLQFIFIAIGVVITFVYLMFFANGIGASSFDFHLLNEDYPPMNLFNQFFIIGGVYFLGPDIMSRNLISKSAKTAKRSALVSGIVLIGYTVIIVMIGLWVRANVSVDELGEQHALMYLMANVIPKPVMVLLFIGLVSAILSSIDTCIVNASSIFVNNILRKENVNLIRATVIVIGLISLAFTLLNQGDIITMLSGAYSVYTPGVICPLLVAILVYKKKELRRGMWLAAVICGGVFGLVGAYFPGLLAALNLPLLVLSNLSLIGMGISLILALASVKWTSGPSTEIKEEVCENL